MMRNFGLILFAVLSFGVHVTAAVLFLGQPDTLKEERGAGVAALEVGSLFDSLASTAAEPEVLERSGPEMTEVSRVEPKRLETMKPDRQTLQRTALRQAISVKEFIEQPAERRDVAALVPEHMNEVPVAQTKVPLIEEVSTNDQVTKPDILQPRILTPVETKKPIEVKSKPLETKPFDVKPVERTPRDKPKREIKTVKVLEPKEIKPKKVLKRKTVKKKKQVKKRSVKKVANKTSKASIASRRGGAQSTKNGRKEGTGGNGGKKANARGRSLMTNYKGRIYSKIRKKSYFPPSLRGKRVSGVPVVFFRVFQTGQASGIRISRSSGNAKMDKAAMRAVKRASPFGKFPKGTGKTSMSFTIEIKMRGR